jgi:pimeloyl-ACP methyl ester carboxylesterase
MAMWQPRNRPSSKSPSRRSEVRAGARRAFRQFPRKPTDDWIVLVPGAGATSAIWRRQLRALRGAGNVLLIELRGHGRLPKLDTTAHYTFDLITADILAILNRQGIRSAHFVALSLGSLIVETLARSQPHRVKSLLLVGGIAKLDAWARLIMYLGSVTKRVLPYMWLYRIFAWVIMPGPSHRHTRRLFHVQARRLTRPEFLRWYEMTREVHAVIRANEARAAPIRTLFVMGDRDYMFRRHARERALGRDDTQVAFVPDAGHVCNIEQPEAFNKIALDFLART